MNSKIRRLFIVPFLLCVVGGIPCAYSQIPSVPPKNLVVEVRSATYPHPPLANKYVIVKKYVSGGYGEGATWTTVRRGKTGPDGKSALSVKGIPGPVSTWSEDGTNYPPFSHVVIIQNSNIDMPTQVIPLEEFANAIPEDERNGNRVRFLNFYYPAQWGNYYPPFEFTIYVPY